MKTANTSIRSAILAGLIAGLTAAAGLLPVSAAAQEGSRTLATGSSIPLSPGAPDEYVVKPGDTLWDLSKVFLRDAWYWPEIWYLNPQVANPHLIYPGDRLKLIYIDGAPRVTLAERAQDAQGGGGAKRLSPQVRREPLSRAITAIPYEVIATFLGRPTLLDASQVKEAPYIVAMRDDHVIGSAGNELYVMGLDDAEQASRHSIIHVGDKIFDPETGAMLGYSGVYVGSGPILVEGSPAKLLLTESMREALQGDKAFPEAVDVNLDFVPHAPETDVSAAIIAVQDHSVMGQYQIVALNRGAAAGLEPGHVLATFRAGEIVRDDFAGGGLATGRVRSGRSGGKVQLPDERTGLVMVFKAYERMSYAIVMEATHEIRYSDFAANP
jgi:LysM domain